METVRVHVNRDNYIAFSCPHCSKPYRISVANFKNNKHEVITRCSCEKRFEIELNFRRFYRKSVQIEGEVMNLSTAQNIWFSITVLNLSMSGLRFRLKDPATIKLDDLLQVKFTLDDQRADLIDKEVIVRDIRKNIYGCEFNNLAYEEKELGFYLFTS